MFVNDRKHEKEANRFFYGSLAFLFTSVFFAVYFIGM